MGLWFPKRLPGQTRPAAKPKPPKPTKPKPRTLPEFLAFVARESAIVVTALAVLLVLPWP